MGIFFLKHLPLLIQVIIVGPTSEWLKYQHEKVTIFPFHRKQEYSFKMILSNVMTEDIYISIDKDVLHSSEVITNWDQGVMTVKTLIDYLRQLLLHKRVIGIDICGEAPLSPINLFSPKHSNAIQKNEEVNLKILEVSLGLQQKYLA